MTWHYVSPIKYQTQRNLTLYSISDLEKLSGIKAHTIRIWEQRYSILQPKRTSTNIRFYEEQDLKTLLNIAFLKKNGYKISKIAKMSDQDFQQAITEVSGPGISQNVQLDALTLSMMEMDEVRFNDIISENIRKVGFEKTMLGVIYPFLEKMSMLWLTGSVTHAQESFITILIRQKLLTAIDNIEVNKKKSAQKFVLYLPKGENQELSLQLMHFLLKVRNFYVVYLGADMTVSDVADAVHIIKPDYVFTMITETYVGESIINYVSRMKKQFPDTHLLLSGYQVVAQNLPNSDVVTVLRSLGETIEYIDKL